MVRSFLTHVDTAGSHRVFERTGDCAVVAGAVLLVMALYAGDDSQTVEAAIAIFAADWNNSRRVSLLSTSI
jgi:hypothetical protein